MWALAGIVFSSRKSSEMWLLVDLCCFVVFVVCCICVVAFVLHMCCSFVCCICVAYVCCICVFHRRIACCICVVLLIIICSESLTCLTPHPPPSQKTSQKRRATCRAHLLCFVSDASDVMM